MDGSVRNEWTGGQVYASALVLKNKMKTIEALREEIDASSSALRL
jgi:hypothetical protein